MTWGPRCTRWPRPPHLPSEADDEPATSCEAAASKASARREIVGPGPHINLVRPLIPSTPNRVLEKGVIVAVVAGVCVQRLHVCQVLHALNLVADPPQQIGRLTRRITPGAWMVRYEL